MSDDPKDVCKCGDYRDQHDDRGRCKFNRPGIGHGECPDCLKFRFLRKATPSCGNIMPRQADVRER